MQLKATHTMRATHKQAQQLSTTSFDRAHPRSQTSFLNSAAFIIHGLLVQLQNIMSNFEHPHIEMQFIVIFIELSVFRTWWEILRFLGIAWAYKKNWGPWESLDVQECSWECSRYFGKSRYCDMSIEVCYCRDVSLHVFLLLIINNWN